VRALVRQALRLEQGVGPAADAAPVLPVEQLAAAAFRQRVAEVLGARAEQLGLSSELRDTLERARELVRRSMLVRLLEIGQVDTLLTDAGVAHLFFKGPVLSTLTTGDPDARGAGDIDVLVAPDDVARTVRALTDAGWQRVQELPAADSWAWRGMLRAGNEMSLYGAACAVDVHWRIDPTYDALPPFADLWERRQVVDVGDLRLQTLATPDAFAHLLLHARKDEWTWLRNEVDVHRLSRLPEAWTGLGPTDAQLPALLVTQEHLGLPPQVPAEVRSRLRAYPARARARLLRRVDRAQDRPPRTLQQMSIATTVARARYELRVSRSGRDAVRFASALVLPAHVLANLGAESPWTGVPRLLGVRGRRAVRRVASRVPTHDQTPPAGVRPGRGT
jgi:hypothetical protein